jgi:hypothetical protein
MLGALSSLKPRLPRVTLKHRTEWDGLMLRALGDAFKGPGLRVVAFMEGSVSECFWRTLPWLMAQLPDLTMIELNNVSTQSPYLSSDPEAASSIMTVACTPRMACISDGVQLQYTTAVLELHFVHAAPNPACILPDAYPAC